MLAGSYQVIGLGKPNTFTESARQRIASARKNMNIAAVQEKMETAVTAIIRVMTLFVLETIILPLLFLYLFTRGLNAIWGINLTGYLQPRQRVIATA